MAEERIYDKLCAIDDTGRASALSAEPTVFCGQCGSEAFDPNAVCQPLPLSERGSAGESKKE